MPPADFIEYFFIDRLPVYRLALSFKFFDHRLHHASLDLLIPGYAFLPFTESAKIFIESHFKPPFLLFFSNFHLGILYHISCRI